MVKRYNNAQSKSIYKPLVNDELNTYKTFVNDKQVFVKGPPILLPGGMLISLSKINPLATSQVKVNTQISEQ